MKKDFDNWNKAKKGNAEIVFTSRYSQPDPDYDFIDLDALLCNVCISLRDDFRREKTFNKKFDDEHELI